jgi:hypothetical protein
MYFDKIYAWALGVVIAAAVVGQLDNLKAWIWRAQARVLYESRTATWGTPRFFPAANLCASKTVRCKTLAR